MLLLDAGSIQPSGHGPAQRDDDRDDRRRDEIHFASRRGILDERENRGMTDPRQCRPPKVLAKIDDRIDEIANTEQWIGKREGPPKPVSSADAGPCNPPFTVQSNGTRVFKKECLR